MTAALDTAQRTALGSLIHEARSILEVDLASTLEGEFGIHRSDGRIEQTDALSLNVSQAAVRIDLLDIVAYLRNDGESEAAAVERLVREAAFTHVNRLVALRVAEGLSILPEAIGNGLASQGFRDFAEIAPASADEEWERFRLFVRICADELSADVPALFDPRNPLLELEPSTAAFSELIELLVAADEMIWSAPDTLGWSYQFFNTAEERKEMRESSAPRNSRELAVRNQFFTPSYVVEFLVQNGLGAHLAASFPALADEMQSLVEVPERRPEPIDLREVSALDPACGSGHFLLGAYDVLEAAWQHAGVQPEDSAPDIVRSLCGIDIDPRATQIAQAAVILRARRHCRAPLPKPNVICARSLPAGPEADALIATLPPQVGRVVRAIADELVMAPVLGPLLKIEERLDREARDAFGTGQIEGTLSEGVAEEDAASVESLVLESLATIADQTTSTPSQRLFAAEAHDAVRFVEAMCRRYTAGLMNPPFGLCVAESANYLEAAYPESWTELYACFAERLSELIEDNGVIGAITSNTFLVNRRLRKFRTRLHQERGFACVIDLGPGVLHGATVNTASWVTRPVHGERNRVLFLDLTQSAERHTALAEAVEGSSFRTVDLATFIRLPGQPFALHMPSSIASLWAEGRTVQPALATVRTGSKTFDNFRYLRLWWELSADALNRGWRRYEKGGEYRPYLSPTPLLVNWKWDGRELRSYGEETGRLAQVMQGSRAWLEPGLTYPRMSSVGFAARMMPRDHMFDNTSVCIFPSREELTFLILGYMNATQVSCLLDVFGRGRSTENGSVKAIPVPRGLEGDEALVSATREAISTWAELSFADERSPLFLGATHAALERARMNDLAEAAALSQTGVDEATEKYLPAAIFVDGVSRHQRATLNKKMYKLDLEPEERALSFLVGCVFGRWSAQDKNDPHSMLGGVMRNAPLPSSPPALLDGSDCELVVESANGVRSLGERLADMDPEVLDPSLASLFDHEREELVTRVERKFFAQHIKAYTMLGRTAPIYWQLQVPSKDWGVWLYAPRLSRESLFAVLALAERRLESLAIEERTLRSEMSQVGSTAKLSSRVDLVTRRMAEVREFRRVAEHVANLGWTPDLDDGAVLNAAPLADLLPTWKDAAKYRKELKQGKHTWSTVSKYADQL